MTPGDRVVALVTVTKSGRAMLAEEHRLFPHANYIHAKAGDLGTVEHVSEDDGHEQVTVRFDRTGTATLVRIEPYGEWLPKEVKLVSAEEPLTNTDAS